MLKNGANVDKSYSLPISCFQVRISYEIVGAPRKNGQFTVFKDKVNIIIYGSERDAQRFDLHKCAIKLVPDMDRMIIVGAPNTNQYDIFIFMSSQNERDKTVMILELMGCTILDGVNNRFLQRRRKFSTSLPNMEPIHE